MDVVVVVSVVEKIDFLSTLYVTMRLDVCVRYVFINNTMMFSIMCLIQTFEYIKTFLVPDTQVIDAVLDIIVIVCDILWI